MVLTDEQKKWLAELYNEHYGDETPITDGKKKQKKKRKRKKKDEEEEE